MSLACGCKLLQMFKFRSGLTAGQLSSETTFLSFAHLYTMEASKRLPKSIHWGSELLPTSAPHRTAPKPQHTDPFCGSFKHRAGKPRSACHPTDASNPQLLTWFYSHNTLVRKENFIPVVLEIEPRIETRFAEYHLNTLPCLLFVSFDGIPAAVPKPGLKQNLLFPSPFPAEQTQKGATHHLCF